MKKRRKLRKKEKDFILSMMNETAEIMFQKVHAPGCIGRGKWDHDDNKIQTWAYCPRTCLCKKNIKSKKPLSLSTAIIWHLGHMIKDYAEEMDVGYEPWSKDTIRKVYSKCDDYLMIISYHSQTYRGPMNMISITKDIIDELTDYLVECKDNYDDPYWREPRFRKLLGHLKKCKNLRI